MTGDDFVKLCHDEKEKLMNDYFAEESNLAVSNIIKKIGSIWDGQEGAC